MLLKDRADSHLDMCIFASLCAIFLVKSLPQVGQASVTVQEIDFRQRRTSFVQSGEVKRLERRSKFRYVDRFVFRLGRRYSYHSCQGLLTTRSIHIKATISQ